MQTSNRAVYWFSDYENSRRQYVYASRSCYIRAAHVRFQYTRDLMCTNEIFMFERVKTHVENVV